MLWESALLRAAAGRAATSGTCKCRAGAEGYVCGWPGSHANHTKCTVKEPRTQRRLARWPAAGGPAEAPCSLSRRALFAHRAERLHAAQLRRFQHSLSHHWPLSAHSHRLHTACVLPSTANRRKLYGIGGREGASAWRAECMRPGPHSRAACWASLPRPCAAKGPRHALLSILNRHRSPEFLLRSVAACRKPTAHRPPPPPTRAALLGPSRRLHILGMQAVTQQQRAAQGPLQQQQQQGRARRPSAATPPAAGFNSSAARQRSSVGTSSSSSSRAAR